MKLFNIFIILLCVITIILLLNKDFFTNIAENFNGSGYGFRKSFTDNTVFIPLNEVSKSTDFNLLSYINQLKSQIFKNEPDYKITKTEQGIIAHSNKELNNIIIFPGFADTIISENGKNIWPYGVSKKLVDKTYKSISPNNEGHLKSIYYLLENFGYKNINDLTLQLRKDQNKLNRKHLITNQGKVNTIVYNFYDLNLDYIKLQFEAILENYIKKKNTKTIIIGYDSGCIISNLCILHIKNANPELYNLIEKCIYIAPTFGGTVLSIKDYINAFNNKEEYKYNSNELLLNLPLDEFYDKPVVIYNSIGYKVKNIGKIFEMLDENLIKNKNSKNLESKDEKVTTKEVLTENKEKQNKLKNLKYSQDLDKNIKYFQDLHKYSLNNTGIKTLIITSKEDSNDQTPICYNYKNNLTEPPERYYLPNNNKTASYETVTNPEGTIEGLTEDGDQIVPTKNILNLKNLWGDNCEIKYIKNKNHFTVLKSYELALTVTKELVD